MIACTSLLLGALLVYGEPCIAEPEDVKCIDVSAKGERSISDENFKNRGMMNATMDGSLKLHDDGNDNGNTVFGANSSRKNGESELHDEKTVANEAEAHDLKFIEKKVFSVENTAECSLRTAEGLKVGIEKPLDNNFESSLGSPWQQVNDRDVSSGSESDRDESSSSSHASPTDIVPIIDELNPLLESENLHQDHMSIDSSDTASRASSPDHEFDDNSAEEETENQADEEDEEAPEEKDNNESIVKWTADDEKNLMDLGSSELERNRRLENLIAKRRAKKLQRFQTDKNLIDLDAEPLPFMEEISRLNVQIPAISAPRRNPFDLPFDSEESLGLPPIPGSAPSVLLPRRNPFDLPYEQDEESSKLSGESSRPYDDSKIKPYFVAEKNIGTGFASFERQLSEKSDSKESSASESDSVSEVVNRDHMLLDPETHERALSVNHDTETVDQESDLSVQVGSEQEQNIADTGEQEIGELGSSSPVSSASNIEVIDERYDGSSSSSCSEEDDKCIESSIHIESIKPGLAIKAAEGADDSQIADPVYDSSPSALSTVSHIPSLDEDLFSKFKGKSETEANFLEAASTPKAILNEGDFTSDQIHTKLRENKTSVNDVSNSDRNIAENFHAEELMPENEAQQLASKSSKHLDDSNDQHLAMEQPQALESDAGSSSMLSNGLHISKPSVGQNDPVQKSSQGNVASSASNTAVVNSEEAPGTSSKPSNPKDLIDSLI